MTIYKVRGGEDMIKSVSIKMFYFVDQEGKKKKKTRSLHNLSSSVSDQSINTLASVFENLTAESYYNLQKVVTHII